MNKELIEKIIAYNYNEYGSEFGDALVDLKHENEWLHHIIKEVREYIKDNAYWGEETEDGDFVSGKLLQDDDITYIEEILNKGEDKE